MHLPVKEPPHTYIVSINASYITYPHHKLLIQKLIYKYCTCYMHMYDCYQYSNLGLLVQCMHLLCTYTKEQ